jgi:FkbM family methyltransferase
MIVNDIMLRGHRLRVTDDKPTFWAKAAAGAWEPETLDAIEDVVKPGVVFLDIGAWVGPTTLYAAALGAAVVALEADPVAFTHLERNVTANPELSGRVTLIQAAASPTSGTVRLGAPRKLGDSMGSLLLAGKTAQHFEAHAITPGEIAAILPHGLLVLKIDIEGGEYGLLPAIGPLLPPVTTALVAFHPGLLRDASEDEPSVRRQNDRAFQAFSDFRGLALGEPNPGNPRELALSRDCTVRFDSGTGV